MRKNFFGYGISPVEDSSSIRIAKASPKKLKNTEVFSDDNLEISRTLFAVNPVTGLPCGNLAAALSKQPLNVQEAFKGRFASGTSTGGVDDADLAMEVVKLGNESVDSYNARMRELAKREIEKGKSKKE